MRLTTEKVCKIYPRKREGSNKFYAVKETDFSLEPGQLTVMIGRSGGGKSTFLSMMSGLLTPTTGRVLADGQDLYQLTDAELSAFRCRHIGVMTQKPAAVMSLNVLENVLLQRRLDPEKKEDREAAMGWLERFGVAELSGAMPGELSGGELRRVCLARTLYAQPDVILADEPTGDLDDANTALVLETLKEQAAAGCAVLLVTHEDSAAAYADSLWKMNAGELTRCEADAAE